MKTAWKNRSEDPFSSTPTKGGSVSGKNQWIVKVNLCLYILSVCSYYYFEWAGHLQFAPKECKINDFFLIVQIICKTSEKMLKIILFPV